MHLAPLTFRRELHRMRHKHHLHRQCINPKRLNLQRRHLLLTLLSLQHQYHPYKRQHCRCSRGLRNLATSSQLRIHFTRSDPSLQPPRLQTRSRSATIPHRVTRAWLGSSNLLRPTHLDSTHLIASRFLRKQWCLSSLWTRNRSSSSEAIKSSPIHLILSHPALLVSFLLQRCAHLDHSPFFTSCQPLIL